jgi:hypothetical protein
MSNTRRGFLKSTATLAAGLVVAASPPLPQRPAGQEQSPADSLQDSEIKVPKVKFGKAEISRLIVGCNTLYGYAHFNQILGNIMKEWYTPEKVTEVLLHCNQLGINTFNYLHSGRGLEDYERFRSQGGKMHLITQGTVDPEIIVKAVQPLAIYHHGEQTDNAYRAGNMKVVKEYCKKTRQQGVLVGVGSHMPEVLAKIEDEGWDVDFYAGCVYNRRRTPEELRKLLGGELPEMPNEVYLQDDPPRMYKFMKQTKKPCFAFKILAAGRVQTPEQAFKLAFESIKPTDGVFVGMFPRVKDEMKENAYWTMRHGSAS